MINLETSNSQALDLVKNGQLFGIEVDSSQVVNRKIQQHNKIPPVAGAIIHLQPVHLLSIQGIRMESANHLYIWLSRLDELPRSPRSSHANEGPM